MALHQSLQSRIPLILLAAVLILALSACGGKGPEDLEAEASQTAQAETQTETVQVPPAPAIGERYINAVDSTARTKAAREAERYIKEETANHLDRLVLNPESEYWNFPGDLGEFDKAGFILAYDAYVDNNAVKPYRIILIRGNEEASWEVKRFSKENINLTGENNDEQDGTDDSANK
ncbi:MAG: hypothetical protein Q4E22_02630 [Coriobacteriia bacterium]|nr:hypothetical protein [Coriobacteriia bacterium]